MLLHRWGGPYISLGNILQNLLLKRQVSNKTLQPGVLTLELFEPLRLFDLQAAVFIAMVRPCATSTSICRSFVTICSGLFRFLGIFLCSFPN